MANARELLLTEQARARERAAALEREFAGLAEAASSAGTDDEHDPEGATLAFERQHAAALLEAAHEQLAAIEVALGKLAAGQYGVCERCGQPIGADRLAARPVALTCIRCAARRLAALVTRMSRPAAMATLTEAGLVEMRLAKVVGLAVSDDDPSYVAVLEGVSQDQVLPIQIGHMEAFSLAATLTGVEFGRPMGPQFAAGLVRALGGRVRRVCIDRLIPIPGGTAFGSVVEVEGPAGTELVDARPSDALNLLALTPAPLFAAPEVLAEAAARMAGDSADAVLLRRALELEQMTVRRGSHGR